MFSKSSRKWRPIQAFVALTDNDSPESGGFEACLGFHRDFDEWSQSRRPSIRRSKNSNSADNSTNAIDSQEEETLLPPPCVGDFTPIRPLEDKEVIDRFVSIPYKAGDLVCWDYRIPHANSRFNHSSIAREAIYIGLLPAIPLNKRMKSYIYNAIVAAIQSYIFRIRNGPTGEISRGVKSNRSMAQSRGEIS